MLEFIGTSYFTNSIKGNIRWAATELFEIPEGDEEGEASTLLSTECDIYSFGSIILQVGSLLSFVRMIHFAHASLGFDWQGTLLQCEEGYPSAGTHHQRQET